MVLSIDKRANRVFAPRYWDDDMVTVPRTPMKTRTSHRKKAGKVFVILAFGLIVCVAIGNYAGYLRELRIATELESMGGSVRFRRFSRVEIPELWPSDRIVCVSLVMTNVTSKTASDLGLLQGLEILSLTSTEVSDADLERLKGLTNLRELYLNDTKTTEAGRSSLRQSLPNCKIHPAP